MAARARWYCKCGFEGKDMGEVGKHQGKGKGHYQVDLAEWARDKVERQTKEAAVPEFDWTKGVIPSIMEVGPNGPYHPALQNGQVLWYWPNMSFATAKEARDKAMLCLADAVQPASEIVAAWNIYKA